MGIDISSDPPGMEIFTNPLPQTYRLWSLFIMPTERGGYKGIAVTDRQAFYMVAVYAFLLTGIFGFTWQFATYIALLFYPTEKERSATGKDVTSTRYENFSALSEGERKELLEVRKRKANRYIALVTIWNSSDPWTALMLLIQHAVLCFKAGEKWTSIYDIIMIVIACVLFLGGIAAGIIVPANLEMGTVAPANPAKVFLAISNGTDGISIRVQQTRSPAAQRAMGVVEAAGTQLKERVNINPPKKMNWTGPGGEAIEQITYNYNITGVDFGLQNMDAVNFVMSTKGACTLEYGWFNLGASGQGFDVYNQFGSPTSQYPIDISRDPLGRTASASVILPSLPPDEHLENVKSGGNITYAIIPDIAKRLSYSEGTDPWYKTIASNSSHVPFEVASQRPVLSCWQQDTWSYKGITKPLTDLKSLPGLNLPPVIRDDFIPSRMAYPMIYDIASSLGGSILISSTGSMEGLLDAGISKYSADLERLILASFVASGDILRDTTMIQQTYGLDNSAFEAPNKPKPGAGNFVLNSGQVSTLSLKILISVPCIYLFLWILLGCFRCARYTHSNSGFASRLTLRAVGLQAVQLYRLLDEEVCGYRDDWVGRRGHMPHIRDAREIHPHAIYSQAPNTPGAEKGRIQVLEEGTGDILGMSNTVKVGADIPVPQRALFIAPKVEKDLIDSGYHLRFTGPVKPDRGKKEKPYEWSWRGEGQSENTVIDEPGDVPRVTK